MKDYLIIGAGLSGLTTGYYLKQAGFDVAIWEAQAQVGGRIQTQKSGDWQVDVGANTALVSSQPLHDLIDALGLRDQVMVANSMAKKRFIVRGDQLLPLPMSLGSFLSTPLVGPASKLSLFLEPFRAPAEREESVADFIGRRLGNEWRDWVLDPFVSGVFAGNAHKISAQAAFHRVWLMEKDHGSLFKGMFARAKARKADRAEGKFVAGNEMISFCDGMSSLTEGLAKHLTSEITMQRQVTDLQKTESGWKVTCETGQTIHAKKVIVTLDAPDASKLLAQVSPASADLLSTIESPKLAVVALGFKRSDIQHPLDGFGCLIPRSLGIPTLGAIFSSSIFPNRAPQDHVLLSCFLGGDQYPQIHHLSESEMIAQVLKDLRPLLGIQAEPLFQQVKVWNHAIAQYHLGHLDKVTAIRRNLVQDAPDLVTRANWHEGISIPDVIANAQRFAEQEKILHQVAQKATQKASQSTEQ
jgi:oxygen-dependent protoporphyrinogen oxidase